MRKLRIFASLVLMTSALLVPIATPAQAAACPSAFFMGVHGLHETEESLTVNAVYGAFASRLGSGQTTRNIKVKHVPLEFDQFIQKMIVERDQGPISRGVQSLDQEVSSAMAACSRAKIVVFGFSEGAWIVDAWLLQQDSITLHYVAAAGVLADPQYLRGDCCVGIARRAIALSYPPAIPNRFWGNCANGDPVCGGGYAQGLANANRQLADAWKLRGGCAPHCDAYGPATRPMGEALADQTARYPVP